MPLFEVEHVNWIAVREYTLVRAESKDEAQTIFEDKYNAHDIDPFYIVPEAIQVEVSNIERYPMKNFKKGAIDSFDILEGDD